MGLLEVLLLVVVLLWLVGFVAVPVAGNAVHLLLIVVVILLLVRYFNGRQL